MQLAIVCCTAWSKLSNHQPLTSYSSSMTISIWMWKNIYVTCSCTMNMLDTRSLTCTPWISFSCTIMLRLFKGSLKPLLKSCAFAILLTMTTHTLCICRRCCLERWWVGLSPASLLTCSWKYKLVMIVTCLISILSYRGICIFNCNFQHKVLKLISLRVLCSSC